MEEKTQQREGHTSTGSLPHRRVSPKSDTSPGKKQPPDQGIIRALQVFEQLKPHILWAILVAIAICDYFHSLNVTEFLVLIAVAEGSLSLPQAIALLQNRSMPMRLQHPPKEQAAEDQSESV